MKRSTYFSQITINILLTLFIATCGSQVKVEMSGSAEKGPFINGSNLKANILNGALESTGDIFSSRIENVAGEFTLEIPNANALLMLEAEGYFYDEYTGSLSNSPLFLKALTRASNESTRINVLTHLIELRIKRLVANGFSFEEANINAQQELYTALNLGDERLQNELNANISMGDTNPIRAAYLFTVSSIFSYMGQGSTAELQNLLNNSAIDFEDGSFGLAFQNNFNQALQELPVECITENFDNYLNREGVFYRAPNMNVILDQDGDGLLNFEDSENNSGINTALNCFVGENEIDNNDNPNFENENDCSEGEQYNVNRERCEPICRGVENYDVVGNICLRCAIHERWSTALNACIETGNDENNCSILESYNPTRERCEPECSSFEIYDPPSNRCIDCPIGRIWSVAEQECVIDEEPSNESAEPICLAGRSLYCGDHSLESQQVNGECCVSNVIADSCYPQDDPFHCPENGIIPLVFTGEYCCQVDE